MKNKIYTGLFLFALSFLVACNNDDGDTAPEPAAPSIVGTWSLSNEDNAYFVGNADNGDYWWGLAGDDLATRACQMDDTWSFADDGTYTFFAGSSTWAEAWQGVDEGCNAAIAPFVGGTFQYEASETALTVKGTGAYIGLPKITNGGELGNQVAADAYPSSVTYEIVNADYEAGTLELRVVFQQDGPSVYWVINLKRQ